MAFVELGFQERFKDAILAGDKTATTRRSMKMVPGDVFKVKSNGNVGYFECVGTDVGRMETLCERWSEAENFVSPRMMMATIKEIYPNVEKDTVMVTHFFKKII